MDCGPRRAKENSYSIEFLNEKARQPEAQRTQSFNLDVTYRSAQRNVEKLVKAGILQQVGDSSYGKTFFAAEILQAIGEDEG